MGLNFELLWSQKVLFPIEVMSLLFIFPISVSYVLPDTERI